MSIWSWISKDSNCPVRTVRLAVTLNRLSLSRTRESKGGYAACFSSSAVARAACISALVRRVRFGLPSGASLKGVLVWDSSDIDVPPQCEQQKMPAGLLMGTGVAGTEGVAR